MSGVCDDHIANDGYKKVCLMGPDLYLGLACDVDRQCSVSISLQLSICVPYLRAIQHGLQAGLINPTDSTTSR